MKNKFIPILCLYTLSGCSTFSNVFSSNQTEDYNKITYGDQHPNWGNARTPVETPREALPFDGPSREVASTSETGQSDELDPTDERVRGKIETNRGAYVSQYARGDRATKADFIDRSSGDGSLWTGESDSNYFYSKTKVRAMGDIISVKVEEEMVKHIAEEIKKSLNPAEQEVEMALYLKNNNAAKDDKDLQAYRNVAAEDLKTTDAEGVKSRMEKAVRWSQVDLSKAIALLPSEEFRAEIIDRYQNGNYKIRAVKKIMYRGSSKLVSLVAVAPATDFDDADLIKSGKLYEYKVRVAR
jgi:flagellar basal body L-ring protein FlgH